MTTAPHHLASVFVELAGGGAPEPPGVPALLARLTRCSRELLAVRATAVAFAPGARDAPQVAASDTHVRRLEQESAAWKEGPGPTCRRTGRTLTGTALTGAMARQRWPRYAPRALELGCTHAAALPIRGHSGPVGALVLLATRETPLTGDLMALGQSLADFAAVTLLREHEVEAGRALAAQLEHALANRIVIEQAKGALTARHALSPDAAFTVLRGYARSHQRLLTEVAREVVEGRLDPGQPRK
ncbi:GAF and ANTAR domain-containing protein [Streptomyces sp. NPDC059788]|uniref:GAF and ANTAR domain-containing protein n=1 Tax=Streptomyces sp. NPDC059788 TaxID=3346948 RepID=UPI00364EDBE1